MGGPCSEPTEHETEVGVHQWCLVLKFIQSGWTVVLTRCWVFNVKMSVFYQPRKFSTIKKQTTGIVCCMFVVCWFSSASKLTTLGFSTTPCNWILDIFKNISQTVRIGSLNLVSNHTLHLWLWVPLAIPPVWLHVPVNPFWHFGQDSCHCSCTSGWLVRKYVGFREFFFNITKQS